MSGLLLTLLAALTRAFAMPGWIGDGLWPLVFVAVALRCLAWSQRPSLWVDYLGGLVFWVVSFSFLVHVHPLAPLGAAVILGSCWWVEGLLVRLLTRRWSLSMAALCALPAAEYLRIQWFYLGVGGVPWASLGLALEPSPLYAYARVFGESGLVLLAVGGGVGLFALMRARNPRPMALFLVLMVLGSPWLAAAGSSGATLRCLTVQPNISVEDKNLLMSANRFFDHQNDLTAEALESGEQPDLVLWAETMWPYPAGEEDAEGFMRRPWPRKPDEVVAMDDLVYRQQVMVRTVLAPAYNRPYFLTGAHFYYPVAEEDLEERYSPRNTEFVLFDFDGRLRHHFSKQELVPFGESLPFGGRFPGAEAFRRYAHNHYGLRPDFHRTEETGPLPAVDALPSLGGTVCWENVFEAPYRRQADAGAQAFVILSNEDWFGLDGLEMAQMVSATRLRAAETGLALLRVTNTGVTCLVSPDGTVDYGTPPGEPGWWAVDLPIAAPEASFSAYRAWGWWIAPLWAAWGLCMSLFAAFRAAPRA